MVSPFSATSSVCASPVAPANLPAYHPGRRPGFLSPAIRLTSLVAACLSLVVALGACGAGGTADSGIGPDAAGPGAADSGTVGNDGSVENNGIGQGQQRRDATVIVGAWPINFDFTSTGGAAIPQLLMNNVYETLVGIDQEGSLVPLLAQSWSVSEDGLVYEFTLRQDVTFSNGQPLTSADVVASFDRVSTDWQTALAASFDVIEQTQALDTYTVQVTLTRPSNQWLYFAATAVGAIFPADLTGIDLQTQAIGTGPFTVAHVEQGDHIRLQARSDYWGGQPYLDTITVRYILDASAAVNALRAGDADMLVGVASGEQVRVFADEAAQMAADPSVTEPAGGQQARWQVIEGSSTGEVLWSFNNRREPFTDIRVRQAFAHAVDRQLVMEFATAGYGQLVGAMVTPQDPFFEDLSGLFPFDPERARELLAEAGYADGLTVNLEVPNLGYAITAAEVIYSQLGQVGVTVNIEVVEFPAVWLDRVFRNHDFDMSIIMHMEAWDLLTVLQPDYYLGFDRPDILQAAAVADAGSREEWIEGMAQVVRDVAQEVPGVVLYLAPTLIVADAGLTGIMANSVTESLNLTSLRWDF